MIPPVRMPHSTTRKEEKPSCGLIFHHVSGIGLCILLPACGGSSGVTITATPAVIIIIINVPIIKMGKTESQKGEVSCLQREQPQYLCVKT